jgi:hypothetical protein
MGGEMFQLPLLQQPQKIPWELIESIHRNIEDLQRSQFTNCLRDPSELVVPQAENLEISQVEDLASIKCSEGVVGEIDSEEWLKREVSVFRDGRLMQRR